MGLGKNRMYWGTSVRCLDLCRVTLCTCSIAFRCSQRGQDFTSDDTWPFWLFSQKCRNGNESTRYYDTTNAIFILSQHHYTEGRFSLHGLYTKRDSFTPRKNKITLIRTLTYRCFRICSSPTLLRSVPVVLLIITLMMCWIDNKTVPIKRPTITVPQKEIFLVLPYLKFYACIGLKDIFETLVEVLFP